MARPVKRRRICELPMVSEFAPTDCGSGECVEMTLDEYETIRLIDYMGLLQEDCALQMNVARTTIQSIYNSARRKTAEALVCGKRLKICGGAYDLCPNTSRCCGKRCLGTNCAGKRCRDSDGGPSCCSGEKSR